MAKRRTSAATQIAIDTHLTKLHALARTKGIKPGFYSIDLSAVTSRHVRETAKNIGQLFMSVDAAGAVLLFDEADALFGRRTDVKDAHDRYANAEADYLLQRLETGRPPLQRCVRKP